MTGQKLYHYAIARFIPDLLRNEPTNIGILFFDDESNFYQARFVDNFRVKLGNSASTSDRRLLTEYKHYFESLKLAGLDQLKKQIQTVSGKFQFTDIKSVVSDAPGRELVYLYNTL